MALKSAETAKGKEIDYRLTIFWEFSKRDSKQNLHMLHFSHGFSLSVTCTNTNDAVCYASMPTFMPQVKLCLNTVTNRLCALKCVDRKMLR